MKVFVFVFLIFALSACSSTEEEINKLTINVSKNSTKNQVISTLGNPIKKFSFQNFEVFYYCQNPEWNEMLQRYIWFNDDELIHSELINAPGVICDKRIPQPSFSGVFHSDYSLYLPTTSRYGQDIEKACKKGLSNERYQKINNLISFDDSYAFIKPDIFGLTSNADIEPNIYLSYAILLNECLNRLTGKHTKRFKKRFPDIPKEIREKVNFEISNLFSVRAELLSSTFIDLSGGAISLESAIKEIDRINKELKNSESLVVDYIFNFKEQVAIAKAGATKVTTNVRVEQENTNILNSCRIRGTCF